MVWRTTTAVPPWLRRRSTPFHGRRAFVLHTTHVAFFFCFSTRVPCCRRHSRIRYIAFCGLTYKVRCFGLHRRDQAESRRPTSRTCRGCSGACCPRGGTLTSWPPTSLRGSSSSDTCRRQRCVAFARARACGSHLAHADTLHSSWVTTGCVRCALCCRLQGVYLVAAAPGLRVAPSRHNNSR